jgi:PAS domain S-box-containing protein
MPSRASVVAQPDDLHSHGNLAGRDVADVETEEHGQRQEQKWRVLDMMLASFTDFAYAFDRDGRFLYANRPLLNLWGLALEDAVGKNFFDLGYPDELATRLQRQVQEVFATGQTIADETQYSSPTGVLGYYEYTLSGIVGIDGTVELVAGASRDITVRKYEEEHLVQMEARYRGLLEAAPDAMVVVDQGGEIVLLNVQAESQFGYSRDELIGQKVTNIIPEGFAERLIADGTRTAAEALAQQIGTGIELVGSRKDGSEFPIEIMLSPLQSAEGILVTVAIRNITVRKDLEKRIEERTKAIEQQWRNFNTTIASIVDHAFMFDPKGRFVYANQAMLDLLERTSEEVVGKTCFELPYSPEIAGRIRDQIQQVVSTKQKVVDVTHYVNPSGIAIYSEYFLSPMMDADGVVEFVAGGAFDITKRKIAEVHLAQMEGRYRGLLEAAPDGMVVVNEAGEIVLLNAQAEKHFGYRRDELLGQDVKNIIPEGFAERLIADGTRTAADALAQQIGTGIELIGRRKDESEFPIEIMLSPLESAEGILVTAAIRDITVRKDAERHLAQMEGRYRGLLEAAPDGMVVVNQRGEIVLLNARAEKQFRYWRDELIGQKVKSIIPEGFAERLIADGTRTAAEALAQQIGTGIELTGRRKDGSEFPIEIMLSPLESAGEVLVTAAIRDITVRKEADANLVEKIEELNRSNEELEQFAYVASHDLQEPLRMVASYTQLLSKRYKGKLDSDADEFIAFAVDGANRMQRLIQDLLTYSRIGKMGFKMLDISSDHALQQALVNLRGAIEESGALVTYGVLPEVRADEVQLVQLFQNLVGNAIKYQGPGVPHIHISAVRNGAPKWIFSVQDDGLGIDSHYFERIFGMFQRLHQRDEFEGTGMGLAICKKIVERHGGNISVESKPGLGSTFHFELAAIERK